MMIVIFVRLFTIIKKLHMHFIIWLLYFCITYRVSAKLYCSTSSSAFSTLADQIILTLKALITAAADDIDKYFLIVFQRKWDLIFHVNPLPFT